MIGKTTQKSTFCRILWKYTLNIPKTCTNQGINASLYSLAIVIEKNKSDVIQRITSLVGVRRLELPTSTSRTWRAANCATPRAVLRLQS